MMRSETPIDQIPDAQATGIPANFSHDAVDALKARAKRLRTALASRDVMVSHAGSLELKHVSFNMTHFV
ncbi:glyoxalase superfamily protein [uncultured Thalassospira sp.]|uniref:glyoxalase superfamily protein n=1 Tax=uncultured Thalassospira sp. TaxID=404382 RepID=UPI0030D811C4